MEISGKILDKMDTAQQSNHLSLGYKGEDLAIGYLETLGYDILERNWMHIHKELDIIAIDTDELVVAEVKTRTMPVMDSPERTVDLKKQRNIITAANAYIRFNKLSLAVRFDIIWVVVQTDGSYDIKHYKDAFIPAL